MPVPDPQPHSDGGHDDKVLLLYQITVFVHPVCVATHPSYPPGWRWSVVVGGMQAADLDFCVGAGHADSESVAAVRGEEVGAAAVLALRHFGVRTNYAFQRLDWDPIPAEADHRPLEHV
jgi:hypothetical protein